MRTGLALAAVAVLSLAACHSTPKEPAPAARHGSTYSAAERAAAASSAQGRKTLDLFRRSRMASMTPEREVVVRMVGAWKSFRMFRHGVWLEIDISDNGVMMARVVRRTAGPPVLVDYARGSYAPDPKGLIAGTLSHPPRSLSRMTPWSMTRDRSGGIVLKAPAGSYPMVRGSEM